MWVRWNRAADRPGGGNGIPRQTVHRLLKQLIEAGAVRREGTRYRLGASLLGLVLASHLSVDYGSSPADRWPNSPRHRRRGEPVGHDRQ